MPQTRWLLAGAVVAVAAIALLVAALGRGSPAGVAGASPSGTAPSLGATASVPAATSSGGASPSPAGSASPSATAAVSATTPAPSRVPATPPPRASGPPLLAWAEFLSHLNDDRSTVEGLNGALTRAAEAQDADAVRVASVDILDFVDVERDWLREHPPADCYAEAHRAATAMIDAYGTAAERFIDWTTTGGGLGGLSALGVALGAADAARTAFNTFVAALEGTRCPT